MPIQSTTIISTFHGSQVYNSTVLQYIYPIYFDKTIANFAAMIGNPLSLDLEDMDISKTLNP